MFTNSSFYRTAAKPHLRFYIRYGMFKYGVTKEDASVVAFNFVVVDDGCCGGVVQLFKW